MSHANGERGEAGERGFSEQTTVRLGDDEHGPAVLAEPASLGKDAKLLTSEAGGRFGVNDERGGRTRSIQWTLIGR
jgi:hypothetical protein